MNSHWLMWSGALDDKIVSDIITECEYYKPQSATMAHDGSVTNSEYRTSELRWIDKNDVNSKFIHDMLWDYADKANRQSYGFDIRSIYDIQYTIYKSEEGGKYDWHYDTFWGNPSTFDRKLSVVVQLSDPSEYEGGEFELEKQYTQPNPIELKKKGTVLVFPSFLAHRVKKVTSGVRKSLVTWIEGPKFK